MRNLIHKHYTDAEIRRMFDEEVLNWIEDDWETESGCESEHEWYNEYCSGKEAEDVVAQEIMGLIKAKEDLTTDDYKEVISIIYSILE